MFPWNIAKSAEAILSRFAAKRLCKFLLKKKLGQFIHGDIDLDQLDVQLSAGLLQLTNLALNVDYLNEKLLQASIFRIKEGSINSLVAKMPWNGDGCEVEVDELELVLCLCCDEISNEVDRTHGSNEDYGVNNDMGQGEHDMVYKSLDASVNVHEGVKTVAKMVKWLLTSFRIKIKNVIVAFDACVEETPKDGYHDALVMRVAEIECGASISEDRNTTEGANAGDFLGISHLTNFLEFQGATIELVQMCNGYNETYPAPQAASLSCFPSNTSKPVLTGQRAGFCGTMKLSIPWKNGSLDTRKVDAELNVDTVIAKLHPSTLKWILAAWELLESYEKKRVDQENHIAADTVIDASTSQRGSSTSTSSSSMFHKSLTPEWSSIREELVTDVLLKESQFISDWVPFSTGNCENEGLEEANLGASVDQFFECFDAMRSSQLILGSSGMWNWTCSVFSAVTAASNLASGALNVSTEQQNVEMNLKINLGGLSTLLSFSDDVQLPQHKLADELEDIDFDVRHLGLYWQDIVIDVQVYPKEWKMEANVKHIFLDDLFIKGDSIDICSLGNERDLSDQTLMIQALQDTVVGVLPLSCKFAAPSSMEVNDTSNIQNTPFNLSCKQNSACRSNIVKASLFQTSGVSRCFCAASSRSFGDNCTTRFSFSLKLPPFILWLNFDLVNMALEFSRKLVNSSRKNKPGDASSELFEDKLKPSHSTVPSTPGKGYLGGNIFLPDARIFLCFPVKNGGGFRNYLSFDQFIALDFSCPTNIENLKEGSGFVQEDTSQKKYFSSAPRSVILRVVNLDVYYITGAVIDDSGRSIELDSRRFGPKKILSLGDGTPWVVLINMLWHEDAVTDARIMKIAKSLATLDESASEMSSATSDYEFASVLSREDKEDMSTHKRRELIMSSKFCLHICLPVTVITLCRSQYLCLFELLSQAVDALSSVDGDTIYKQRGRGTSVTQSSVLLECVLMKFHIELDQGDSYKSSLQRELPGTWSNLNLEIQNLQLHFVSNVGSVSDSCFLWISHDEGKLWGSITSVADQDFLLVSCSNGSNGRRDGEGSNELSCSHAGTVFVHVTDQEHSHNYILINLKCWTIVAPGGRLDWLDKIFSFFSLSYPEKGQVADGNTQKRDSEVLSFAAKFTDSALSYEPYFLGLEVSGECLNSKSHISVSLDDNQCDPYIACLLAASSLTISSTTIAGSLDNYYSIRLRDVGFLLHELSKQEKSVGEYSVDHLRELGYVKVAREALVDAILRINCENDIYWELNCSESHVVLSTCHDTTLGLIRLASQLQQVFAPDMEESLIHLQNRWNFHKHVQGEDDGKGVLETCNNSSSRTMQVQQLHPDSRVESRFVSLMDEISEDAFLFHGKTTSSCGSSESSTVHGSDKGLLHEGHSFNYICDNYVEDCHSSILQEPEIMESYCLSDLRSLSELTSNSYFSEGDSPSNLESQGYVDVQRGKSGWYGSTSLSIFENYIQGQTAQSDSEQLQEDQHNCKEENHCQRYKGRLLLNKVDFKWRMYAGSDWCDSSKTTRYSKHLCRRDETLCLELALSNMNVHYDIFPDGDLCVSKLCLSVQDLHLYDRSINAPWRQVLGYYSSKERPRKTSSKALKLELEAVRPDPMTPLEEYRLRLAALPILLHLHQSQLDFLISFFGGKYPTDEPSQDDDKDSSSTDVTLAKDSKLKGLADEALLPFFQKFDIWPIILRVDYRPSRVDLAALSGGKYVELVNLVPWKGVELHLKHVEAAGIYGWANVCETIAGEWLEDISQHQVHKLLQGLPAIRSLVTVGSSAAKLVSLPVKNYKKDNRLVKGLQRGTVAFLRSISVEALGLGVHLAAGTQEILLHAECILARIQPSLPHPIRRNRQTKLGPSQPEDAQQGLRQAYESLSDGLGKTASALIHAPMKTYQHGGGAGSALMDAVRGAPVAAIAPASAAAQALHRALVGVRNSLDPERKEESLNKYLGPSRSLEKR
ncbi:unnamed protein product [Amaranthus hypochondriacus]